MFHQIIKPILFAVTVAFIAGCKKDDPEPPFVAGNIIVGFEKEIAWRQGYDFANKYANEIGYVHGLYYYSNLPNDSLNFVKNFLGAEGFEDADVRIGFTSKRIEILKDYFIDDDKSTINNWILVSEDPILKFEDMQKPKSMLLYITPGTEKLWIETHTNNPLIRYIELDYYIN